MAQYKPSEVRQAKGQTAPQEPNLVPIMNLFLTIIPFMLMFVVISQVSLVALNFSQGEGGGGSGGGGGGKADQQKVEIHILGKAYKAANGFMGMEIREPGIDTKQMAAISDAYDFVALDRVLKDVRSRKTSLTDITVLVHPDVLYGDMIKTIDLCKDNGFTQVHYTRPKVSYYY
ncbi:hypothetical protein MASR1M36_18370 [Candidatus Cloacimonadaceae bacterium]